MTELGSAVFCLKPNFQERYGDNAEADISSQSVPKCVWKVHFGCKTSSAVAENVCFLSNTEPAERFPGVDDCLLELFWVSVVSPKHKGRICYTGVSYFVVDTFYQWKGSGLNHYASGAKIVFIFNSIWRTNLSFNKYELKDKVLMETAIFCQEKCSGANSIYGLLGTFRNNIVQWNFVWSKISSVQEKKNHCCLWLWFAARLTCCEHQMVLRWRKEHVKVRVRRCNKEAAEKKLKCLWLTRCTLAVQCHKSFMPVKKSEWVLLVWYWTHAHGWINLATRLSMQDWVHFHTVGVF